MCADKGTTKDRSALLDVISFAIMLFWTAALLGLLFWAVAKERQNVLRYAQMEARANFNKDMALRNWAAKRGGVYVEVSKDTPPNPYLAHLSDRDLRTPAGKQLTLMNPAYMLRQIMNEYAELYGIKGRITSLKPSNPINAPDAWEVGALERLEHGAEEVSEFAAIDGKPHLRYMQAFRTKADCLKCHRHQGYKEGDVRGGIGVSVPLQSYLDIKQHTIWVLFCSYGILWLLGGAGIVAVNRFAKRQILRQLRTEGDLVAEKERLELVVQGTGLGLWDWNPLTNKVVFDERWANMMGFKLEELESSLDAWKKRVHPDDLAFCFRDIQAHVEGKTEYYSNIHRMLHRDGKWRYILDRGKIVERDAFGRPVRFIGTHTDVTRLKETENALREKTEALRMQASELERLNKMLAQQARYDGLTQVHNRRAFDQRLQEAWECWRRNRDCFSILMADIDFFKNYNDAYGHLQGDACLQAVAREIQNAVGNDDFAARYGGEEFVLLLPGAGIKEAMLAAEGIRLAVEQLALPHRSSDCAKVVTLSVGVATAVHATDEDSSELVALADKALYLAKRNGRNCTASLPDELEEKDA